MANTRPEPNYSKRSPQRVTITVPWSLYQNLTELSTEQGRSISNLAAHWLERQLEALKQQAK